MTAHLDDLNTRVTAAIFHAEATTFGSPEYQIAYRQVSDLEGQIARVTAATDFEGVVARRGAVWAAVRAGDWLLASQLAEEFLEPHAAYRTLMFELLRQRALAGGALPLEQESNFVTLLDRYWHQLTEEQRTAVEQEFAGPVSQVS